VSAPDRQLGGSPDATCLVTGATGFIGGHLVRRLVQEGYRVRCLVRSTSDTSGLSGLEVEIVVGDLTRPESLRAAVAGCRCVVHCAALVSDWATRAELMRVNVGGTHNLLEASVNASVRRFVHFSTTDVYGYPGTAEVEETFVPTRFCNWYAQTKLAAESEIAQTTGTLETVILRPATVYGPGSTEVVLEIARAIRGGNMILIGGGRAVAGLCFVDNLIDATVIALRHDAARGHAFNITDGIGVTWRQFVDGLADGLGWSEVRWSLPYWLAEGVGLSLEHCYRTLRTATHLETRPLLSRQAVQVMGRSQSFSNQKARVRFGWTPRVDYAAGLAATLEWLRSQGLARVA
jgi:nucleoside-diphosphate-sugar epimerase